MRRHATRLLTLLLVTPGLGCGLLGGGEAETDAAATDGAAEGGAEEAAEGGAGAAEGGGAEASGSGTGSGSGGVASLPPATGVDKFKTWLPVHALLNAPVTAGTGVGANEAIVATRDSHVGVTQDGGKTWHFVKHPHGAVFAVDGYDGGPYVAVGSAGYTAISADGVHWRDLHRYTANPLIGVVAADAGIVAISSKGEYVKYDKEGKAGVWGVLPDNFKAGAVTELAGAIVAYAGTKAYGTADGVSWTPLESSNDLPRGGEALTSAGVCRLGKVGKQKGVVCSVTGTAHGITDTVVAVENKGAVSLTSNGGQSWTTARLPFSGATSIFGTGPYYAVGSKGSVAKSTNGTRWVDQEWEESANLNAGIVDGTTVVVVGDKGTIVYSKDGGTSWDYAQPPVSGNFSFAAKADGKYMVTDGRTVLTSPDAVAWTEDASIEAAVPGKPGDCAGLPTPGDRCRFAAFKTTPEGLPDVRTFSFSGNTGMAMGDSALVAFTSDGGANWSVRSGLDLGFVSLFDVAGQALVASNGKRIVVSNDGAATWTEGQVPGKNKFTDILIASNGNAYATASGVIMVSGGTHESWAPAATQAKNKTKYVGLHEVGSNVYAVGSKGELWSSSDGQTFGPIVTSVSEPIVAMTGDGDQVFAVTAAGRKTGSFLLRSEDGGGHFYIATELSDGGRVGREDFAFVGGKLRYRERVSTDFGFSWNREEENYWSGAVATDQAGISLTNRVFGFGKDKLYAITGTGERDWVLLEGVFSEGGTIRCDGACWMHAAGTVYRPL